MNEFIFMIISNFSLYNIFFCYQLFNYFYKKILKLPDVLLLMNF